MDKRLALLLLLLVTVSVQSNEWTSRQVTSLDNYLLTLDFFSNASGVVGQTLVDGEVTKTGYRNDPPLIIYSNAKKIGETVSLACQTGFLQDGGGCYTCPQGFDVNVSKNPGDSRKCVKFYASVNDFDGVYTEELLVNLEPRLTQRQLRCILKEEQCYTGFIGKSQSQRYGINCGLNNESKNPFLLDNLDKCCLAYGQHRWSNNIVEGYSSANPSCANDINMLRCARKIIVDQHYVTEEEKNAALLTFNRLATPLMTSCPVGIPAITGDDNGPYPWNAIDSNNPEQAYTHRFESSSWVRNGEEPADLPQDPNSPSPLTNFSVQ